MVAEEEEVLSHCPLQLIFTQDKASFIHFPCQCFIGLPEKGSGDDGPTIQNETWWGQRSAV